MVGNETRKQQLTQESGTDKTCEYKIYLLHSAIAESKDFLAHYGFDNSSYCELKNCWNEIRSCVTDSWNEISFCFTGSWQACKNIFKKNIPCLNSESRIASSTVHKKPPQEIIHKGCITTHKVLTLALSDVPEFTTIQSSADKQSYLYTIFDVHFLLTAKQEFPSQFILKTDTSEITTPVSTQYESVQISLDTQGLRIAQSDINDDTSKVILCYLLALTRNAKFSDFFKEIQDAIGGTEIAYKKIERTHNEIHELDFKCSAITQSDQAIGELWNQLALSGILDTGKLLKERLLTLTKNVKSPYQHRTSENTFLLALLLSIPTIFIAFKELLGLLHTTHCAYTAITLIAVTVAVFYAITKLLELTRNHIPAREFIISFAVFCFIWPLALLALTWAASAYPCYPDQPENLDATYTVCSITATQKPFSFVQDTNREICFSKSQKSVVIRSAKRSASTPADTVSPTPASMLPATH